MTLDMPGELIAIVPMKAVLGTPSSQPVGTKATKGGKTRLSKVLDSDSSAAFSLFLLQKVLTALNRSEVLPKVWVVGGDEPVQAVAREESARWLEDPGGGLNGAVSFAVNAAFREGAAAVLVLPGDLGLIQPQDVEELAEMSSGLRHAVGASATQAGLSSLVLAAAESDGGTNAILAPAGMMVGPFFGQNSFSKHLEAAFGSGLPVVVASLPGLAFDLDTPQDLERYRKECPDLDQFLSQIKTKYLSAGKARRSAR